MDYLSMETMTARAAWKLEYLHKRKTLLYALENT